MDTKIVTKFLEGGTHRGGILRKMWVKKVEDLKAQGVKRQHTRMKGTTKWTRTVSCVKVIHGP